MIGGFLLGVVALVGISIGCKKYINKRFKREVEIIDNISYPINVRRNRKITSTRINKSSRRTRDNANEGSSEEGRRIPIPKNSSSKRSESVNAKSSRTVELHKPTAL